MTAAAPPAVELIDLRRSFSGTAALDGLHLTIEPGSLMCLLGPSGCGKTTALRIIAGLEHADAGEVRVGGKDVTRTPANKRDMGMVFQSYSLFPNLDALDNVAFGLRVRGWNNAKRRTRAGELLELVGLAEHSGKYTHQLSGGQQQRVALARALAIEPCVLLLDEPLSALDAVVRVRLRDEIRSLQTRLGITTVFVTHDQEEALCVADQVAVMKAGRLEQCAPPAEVYANPATAFVAEFIGTMNRLPGVVSGESVDVAGHRLAVRGERPAEAEVSVLLRPEAVRFEASEEGTAVIRQAGFRGPITRIVAELADGTEVLSDIASDSVGELAPGRKASMVVSDASVMVVAR